MEEEKRSWWMTIILSSIYLTNTSASEMVITVGQFLLINLFEFSVFFHLD